MNAQWGHFYWLTTHAENLRVERSCIQRYNTTRVKHRLPATKEYFNGLLALTHRSAHLRFCLYVSQLNHSFTFRSRKALPMTETELRLIAAPAMTGLSSRPTNG